MRGPGLPPGRVVDDLVCNIDLRPTLCEAAGIDVPREVQGKSLWGIATGESRLEREAIFTERNYHGGFVDPRPDGTSANYDPMRSVRTPRYHLIRNFDPNAKLRWSPDAVPPPADTYTDWFDQMFAPPTQPRPEYELYDCSTDPWERTNLADDPALADVRRDLETRLDEWMRDTDDPLLNGPIPDRLNGWPEAAGERRT
jgi:arylsulfatase A-like enzyme